MYNITASQERLIYNKTVERMKVNGWDTVKTISTISDKADVMVKNITRGKKLLLPGKILV